MNLWDEAVARDPADRLARDIGRRFFARKGQQKKF